MFQEKNCYTTGHQLRNVIRHAHVKVTPLDFIKAWFSFTASSTTKTQKESSYEVDKSSFTLIVLFWLEIGRYRGRKWLKAWFPLHDKCD